MDLSEIRQHINRIDAQMKGLFLERMSFAAKVAEEKRCTGGSVFVPEREREILQMRQKDVGPELAMECRACFGQLMGISRTYQYAKLAGVCSRAGEIPDRPGAVDIVFSCGEESGGFASALNAISLGGLLVLACSAGREGEGSLRCKLRLEGDFSQELAKAAVLQILEEADGAVLIPVDDTGANVP